MYSSGSARPSSIASSMALIEATGVRRSWLAAATSSRRASKRPSRFAAISLNDRPSSASSRGPLSGARAARSPAGDAGRRGLQPFDAPRDRRPEDEPGGDGGGCRGRGDGEDLDVVAHVEHDPAGEENDEEREQDREQREPDQLEPDRREQPQPDGGDEGDCRG